MRNVNGNIIGRARSGGGMPQLPAPASLTPTVISNSEIDLAWSSVVNATNYVLERATQSDYSDSTEIYSGATASFNDTGLSSDTIYYYRVKAQAAGFNDSDWTTANATTQAASTYLTFTNRGAAITLASRIYTGGAGGGSNGAKGISDYYLPASTDGYIQMKIGDANSIQNPIWFSIIDGIGVGTDEYVNGRATIFPNAGTYYIVDNASGSAVNTGVTYATNDLYRIRRNGSAFIAEKSVDNGANWTLIYNYVYSSTAQHYVKIQDAVATRNFYEPFQSGLIRRPILFISAGESNSGDGWADNGFLAPTEAAVRNILIFNNGNNTIENLDIGTNNMIGHVGLTDNVTHGLSNGMANEFDAGQFDGTPVILLQGGQGGHPIADWETTDTDYTTLTSRFTTAVGLINTAYGVKPTVILQWCQGINDMIALTVAATWQTATQSFFTNIRNSFAYQCPVLITNFAGLTPNYQDYESNIAAIAAADPRVLIIDSSTATSLKNNEHWQYASFKIMAAIATDDIKQLLEILQP